MAYGEFEIIRTRGWEPARLKYPGIRPSVTSENGMIVERDVAIAMRDGAKLYADICRPETEGPVPVILSMTPYGKHRAFQYGIFYNNADVKPEWISPYTNFEAPDPVSWVADGFAIATVDIRGTWGSEGEASYLGHQEGEDGHDLVEWLAARDWCNGKVGMAGVSYLAIVQWQVAAQRPPSLKAINPWEGASDMYREFLFHGGIPETHFSRIWQRSISYTEGRVENWLEMMEAHPFHDDYWADKVADWSRIEVPAYVVASWSDQGLHLRGTLEAWKALGTGQKWLEIHGQKKWAYFHHPDSVRRQKAFFARFLKGEETGVGNWPRVRLEVRERTGQGRFRDEAEWPLRRTAYRKLFLDAADGALTPAQPTRRASVDYDAPGDGTACPSAYGRERVVFDHIFAEATEVTGHMKLRLWVEARGARDMDLFVAVQKFDADGRYVPFPVFSCLEDGPVALGWLRASHRELDIARSTPHQPWHPHTRAEPLPEGEPVPVEIEIWPSSTRFAAGDRLRLVIQGSDIYHYARWIVRPAHEETVNAGQHVIHTGGEHDSHLVLPVLS